jgi:hypothetical protein
VRGDETGRAREEVEAEARRAAQRRKEKKPYNNYKKKESTAAQNTKREERKTGGERSGDCSPGRVPRSTKRFARRSDWLVPVRTMTVYFWEPTVRYQSTVLKS